MHTTIQQQLVALSLAALVTVGVLGSLDGLASHEAARANLAVSPPATLVASKV
jgi:alkylhydroperoxidase family enzyme